MTVLETLAGRVAAGASLTRDEAQALLESHDLITIGMMGDDVRKRRHGTRTTFVRVFEIHVDAPPAALPGSVTAGEFRIIGRPSTLDTAGRAVAAARTLAGSAPVTGFSLPDLATLGELKDVAAALRRAGLDAVAETPVDDPAVSDAAVTAARDAGLRVERLTITASTPEERLDLVERASALQRSVGGFRTFAPLARTMSIATPTSGYDDVKLVAVARVMVDAIDSIQVDWALYGPKLAQVALTVGADDVDGVAALDAATLGVRRSAIEEIKGNIRAAALEPVERNARFEVVG